jgi:WD40 repeat protein
VKLWDALTGRLQSEFHNLTEEECPITSACLDQRRRRFFIGDSRGKIGIYNYGSGAKMHELTPHDKEVGNLVYCVSAPSHDNRVLCTWGTKLAIHREDEVITLFFLVGTLLSLFTALTIR